MAVRFLPQPQFRARPIAQPALGEAAGEVADVVRERRRAADLRDIGQLAARGATGEELGARLMESGDPTLAGLGLRTLQTARAQKERRDLADREFGLQQRRLGIAERQEKRLQTESDRQKRIEDHFLGLMNQSGQSAVTIGDSADVSPETRQLAGTMFAVGKFSDGVKILADAEQNKPSAVASRKQAERLGAERAKLRGEIESGIRSAQKRLTTFRSMKDVNEKATTGAFSSARLTTGRLLDAMGVDPGTLGINPNLPASEFMQSQQLNVVLDFISQTKGAISEREMDTFAAAAPGLANTKTGNRLILQAGEAIAQREIEIAKRVSQLPPGQFTAQRYNQIAEQVQAEFPMPNLQTQVPGLGGEGAGETNIRSRTQRMRQLQDELERRQRAASGLTGGGL